MDTDAVLRTIKELIEKTTVSVTDISIAEKKDNDASKMTWVQVEVGEPHFFLGRGAEALFALNHLARKIIENKFPNKKSGAENSEHDPETEILIDVNGFQKKRIENIHAIAYMMAERARYFKSNIEVDPMPAFERRIVHEFLSNAPDVKTESQGTGTSRRVVIKYIGGI